ncbi:DUF5327 family protein [Lentibacillus saliphilus]|uniref:DUF5327 family protein n=1 Tax=Lentibacillus saliphilus TaxID=2737028 RepID=UPI001C2FDC59
MNVTHETIIEKMIEELKIARQAGLSDKEVIQHVANVRLLGDLLIGDTQPSAINKQQGVSPSDHKQGASQHSQKGLTLSDFDFEDDDVSDSLLDF